MDTERERDLCEETVYFSPAWEIVGRVPWCKDYRHGVVI